MRDGHLHRITNAFADHHLLNFCRQVATNTLQGLDARYSHSHADGPGNGQVIQIQLITNQHGWLIVKRYTCATCQMNFLAHEN